MIFAVLYKGIISFPAAPGYSPNMALFLGWQVHCPFAVSPVRHVANRERWMDGWVRFA